MRVAAVLLFTGFAAVLLAASTAAQTEAPASPISFRSDAQIMTLAKTLMNQARSGTGVASVKLENQPVYGTMLVARSKTGPSEMHANWSDVMFVLDGEATQVTGGTMIEGKLDPATGETRGTRVDGGTRTRLSKGDVIQIPPNTPHWTIIAPGQTMTAYVVKVAAMNSPTAK